MSLFVQRRLASAVLAALVLALATRALGGEAPEAPDQEAAKRLAALQAQLLAADLVVRARVTNIFTTGDTAVLVLGVHETFRGATARKAVYVELDKEKAAGLDERDAVWLLKATADPRRFSLDGPVSILDADRADEIKAALASVEYAALDDLKLTVSLDKDTYKLDEPIRLTWTIENPTDKPIVIAVPEVWGAGFGITLGRAGSEGAAGAGAVLDVGPRAHADEHEGRFTFTTLSAARRQVSGSFSLLRLTSSYSQASQPASGSLLPPGRYRLKVSLDTTGAVHAPDVSVPKEARLGALQTPEFAFEVADAPFASLDEAREALRIIAGVERLDDALKAIQPEAHARLLVAVRDYSCPALLPFLDELLRSEDSEMQAAACQAVSMWARHPAVIAARPFAKLLTDADVPGRSLIARTAADVAETQKDATMIPLLLKALGDERVNKVSRQSIALSIGAIAGLEIDPDDLDAAAAAIENWVKANPDRVAPPTDQ
jgi:hypothetical protein